MTASTKINGDKWCELLLELKDQSIPRCDYLGAFAGLPLDRQVALFTAWEELIDGEEWELMCVYGDDGVAISDLFDEHLLEVM